MVGEAQAGWLNSLIGFWNSESLDAVSLKLVALLLAMFAVSALAGLGQKGRGSAQIRGMVSTQKPASPRREIKGAPPKNRPKKRGRPVRHYRPRSTPARIETRASGALLTYATLPNVELVPPGLAKFVTRRRQPPITGPVVVDFAGRARSLDRASVAR